MEWSEIQRKVGCEAEATTAEERDKVEKEVFSHPLLLLPSFVRSLQPASSLWENLLWGKRHMHSQVSSLPGNTSPCYGEVWVFESDICLALGISSHPAVLVCARVVRCEGTIRNCY